MSLSPTPCLWDGEAFYPRNQYWSKRCDEQLVVGEHYTLTEHQERSSNSHNHFFAAVEEAWRNLPEDMPERFANAEHLRKWALINTGYYDVRTFVASSPKEARRIASWTRSPDDYALIVVKDNCVLEYTAKSQSYRAMSKKEFQESKTAVLDYLAAQIGTTSDDLKENAKKAA